MDIYLVCWSSGSTNARCRQQSTYPATSDHSIWKQLTPDSSDITGASLAAYIITGCDTVSYPFRIGKKQALNVALKCLESLEPLVSYMYVQGDLEIEATVIDSAKRTSMHSMETKDSMEQSMS